MTSTIIRCIDFETTGFPPEADVIEVGWTDIKVSGDLNNPRSLTIDVGEWSSTLLNPKRKIETAAKAIHHILDNDLEGHPHPKDVIPGLLNECDIVCAHNSRFERDFVSMYETQDRVWICTLKTAYRLCPSAPNHQNQTIRYFLNTSVDPTLCHPAHRAGPDSYVTAHTLAKLLTACTIKSMIEFESEPPLLPTCPIGQKERGKPWAEVDRGFLAWCTRQPTMNPDILWNVKRELDRRDGKTS